MSKQELRSQLRTVLTKIPNKENRSLQLLQNTQFLDLLGKVNTISVFISLADEIDTSSFIQWALDKGKKIVVPVFDPDRLHADIFFRELTPTSPLKTLESGVCYPSAGDEISVNSIDIILTPGLGFTADGKRLGRGKGFYDRILASFAGVSIGICFTEQLLDDLPQDPHDQSVDHVFAV